MAVRRLDEYSSEVVQPGATTIVYFKLLKRHGAKFCVAEASHEFAIVDLVLDGVTLLANQEAIPAAFFDVPPADPKQEDPHFRLPCEFGPGLCGVGTVEVVNHGDVASMFCFELWGDTDLRAAARRAAFDVLLQVSPAHLLAVITPERVQCGHCGLWEGEHRDTCSRVSN